MRRTSTTRLRTPRAMVLRIGVACTVALLLTTATQPTVSAGTAATTTDAQSATSEGTLPTVGRGFRWGVASSAFQTEGGKLPSNWHRYADDGPGGNEPYRNSVDFLHRYREDIRRAAELGVNTYRISINWARVEPRKNVVNRRALRYYDDVVRTIKRHGMQPVITLDHFVYPLWVLDQGAWDNPQTVEDFVDFSRLIAHRYGDQAGWWLIFNEPFCYVATEAGARTMTPYQVALMYDHLVEAHRRVYGVIHRVRPTARVSSNLCTPSLAAPERTAADALFLDQVIDRIDFIGIDYYYRDINLGLVDLLNGEIWKIPLDPEGIYHALVDYHERYPSLPIVVTENGMSTDNGKPREDGWTRSGYLRDTIYWMQRALADDVPVQGFWYWSITDNYEWGSYRPRFGLFQVDVTTDPNLVRHPTGAVRTYRGLTARGGVSANYTAPGHPH